MSRKKIWILLSCLLLGLMGSGYWYVSIAGAPQFDGPDTIAHKTNLKFEIVTYYSSTLKKKRTYAVSLPPGYDQSSERRYPVIFLLHGGHGTTTDWFKKAAALPMIQTLYASGKLPDSIIITPDGNDQRGSSAFFDPQYIDGPNGKLDTALGEELVSLVKTRYRTLPDPDFWAIGGLSSGGWGALNIGLHHPEHFSIMFSHSGYFTDASGRQNSPLYYVKNLPVSEQKQLHIYLDAGKSDVRFLQQTKQFHKVLDQLKIDNSFHAFSGGHGIIGSDVGWNYWHQHLADSLSYVGQQFQSAQIAYDARNNAIKTVASPRSKANPNIVNSIASDN